MGVYSEGLGRYLDREDVSLKASGAETTSTTHAAVELGDKAVLNLEIAVTAASGTPTMVVTIEGSHDGLTWYTLGRIGLDEYLPGYESAATAPANITATGTYRATIPAARFVRSKSTIGGGTPSLTYSIGGSAV